MIQYSEAVKIVKNEFSRIRLLTEKVYVLNSLHRVLAEDIYSDTPQPIFTNSAMDGYTVKYRKGITKWKVIGEISAGKFRNYKPAPGEAVLIMTGSRLPDNADTVIPVEHINAGGNDITLITGKTVAKFQNVRFSGEDIKQSEKVLCKNRIIHANDIQLAASCGKGYLRVYRKPIAGILTTGNELIDINTKPKGDKIRASNIYSLIAGAAESGFQPVNFGIVKDKKSIIKRKIYDALTANIDMLITSGGVSEGKYDFLPEIFKELGVNILFHKVNIKPGKPLLFGVYNKNGKKVLIFGLPGNPVSCFVNFILFVRNIFYSAVLNVNPYNINAVLENEIIKKDNKRHFIRGILNEASGINYVSDEGSQSSANVLGLSSANVLIEFPEKKNELKKGSVVECIKI